MLVLDPAFEPRDYEFILSHRPHISSFIAQNPLWDHSLTQGHGGIVYTALASHWLHNVIERWLARRLPQLAYRNLAVQWNIWSLNSAINPHRDQRYLWAATIYLVESWTADYGGIFTWQNRLTDCELQHLPRANTAVINDSQELHWVTPITVAEPQRLTLQLWAD